MSARHDPEKALYEVKREFGEHGGVCPSVSRSSTYTVEDPKTMPEIFAGVRGPDKDGSFLYSRHFNPTVNVLARYLAGMEGTEYAACTASGMAAISSTLLQICRPGDHIVAGNTVYGGTHALLNMVLPTMGIETTFVPPDDTEAFKRAIMLRTKVFYVETMANPTLKIADIRALAVMARDMDIVLVVDNTFSPMIISPGALGAEVVVYSMTKFINGASDLIAGAICASKDFINTLLDLHSGRLMLLGPTLDPRSAFDIIQRLPHLALRMREHSARAMAMAVRARELGAAVGYPGLNDHPQHELVTSMINPGFGYGGMFNIDCQTTAKAERLLSVLQNEVNFGLIAVSLGYYDTLISCSGSSTSSEIPSEDQTSMGLSPGLVRIAAGFTGNLEDQLDRLENGLRLAKII